MIKVWLLVSIMSCWQREPYYDDILRFPVTVQPAYIKVEFTGGGHSWIPCGLNSPQQVAKNYLTYRRSFIIEAQQSLYWSHGHEAQLAELLRHNERMENLWSYALYAADSSNACQPRLDALIELKERLGPINWYLGALPDPYGDYCD